MSSITPQSFIDDCEFPPRRLPHRSRHRDVAKWITGSNSDTSAYTGSYIDDGVDAPSPLLQIPGFVPVAHKPYRSGQREKSKDVWNDDVQRAIGGDVRRSLRKIRGLGHLDIRKESKYEDEEETGETVLVLIPPTWPTFVIKAEDGRVIVISKGGEFDSGPRESKEKELERWVRADSVVASESSGSTITLSTWSSSDNSSRRPSRRSSHKAERDAIEPSKTKHHRRKHSSQHSESRHKQPSSLSSEILEPVAELESDDDWSTLVEEVQPPTGFFMTGGASGLPGQEAVVSSTPTEIGPLSPVPFGQGGWPISPHSLSSKQSSLRGADNDVDKESHSHLSTASNESHWSFRTGRSHTSSTVNLDDFSTGMHYKPPSAEYAPETSPERAGSAETVRPGSRYEVVNWRSSPRASDKESWTESQASKRKGSRRSSRKSESSWDGFEKVKTASEISVAGSDSIRSTLASLVSSRHDENASTRPNHRSHGSRRSRTSGIGQRAWEGSEASSHTWSRPKAQIYSDESGNSHEGRRRSSGRRRHRDRSQTSHADRYDADNETYLKEQWDGVRIKVVR